MLKIKINFTHTPHPTPDTRHLLAMRYAPNYITSPLTSSTPKLLTFLLGCLLLAACTKVPQEYPDPSLKLITVPGFLTGDTTLMLNDTVKIGLSAETGSDVALTHFHMTVIRDSAVTQVDSALYTNQLISYRTLIKGLAKKETRIFYVRDRYGRKSPELTLTLMLDSASIFGDIRMIQSLTLGAQNNASVNNFYSILNNKTYSLTEAHASQEVINILYYFDNIESDRNTIASPGANLDASVFPGASGLTNWATRNTTRFKFQENITPAEFEACRNDSLILSNTFEFLSGFRKAKNLAPGQVYSFVTDSGYKGLFKVADVQGTDSGTITIDLKIKK